MHVRHPSFMEASRQPSMGKRLFDIVKVVFFMLRKGFSKQKLSMDLHLLKRSKIAGKALSNLMTFHHNHRHGGSATHFSSHREVEFSCSNTPAFPSKRSKSKKHQRHYLCEYDAADVAMAFEVLNSAAAYDGEASVAERPSPAVWNLGKSPADVRPLRITDSPFPEGEVADGRIDKQAEDFIKSFYERLCRQQALPPTPENCSNHRRLA